MFSVVTTVNSSVPPVTCDFGWWYGSSSTPQRLVEASFSVGGKTYPPGRTFITGGSNVTLPTSSNINVNSTTGLESSGWITFYGSTTIHTTVPYTIVDGTHINVTGGTGTYASGTPVYDARFYVDQMPLHQVVTFDAIDSQNLGLPKVSVPTGLSIVLYQWNFGNGLTGSGPYASTTYSYSKPPESIRASLTVYDNLGRAFSCGKQLKQQSLMAVYGTSLREIQVTGGNR